MASKNTAQQMIELMTELTSELTAYIEKGKKASAKRARKLTLDFEKMAKIFRKESVKDSGTDSAMD